MNLNAVIKQCLDRLKARVNKFDPQLKKEQLIFLWLRVKDSAGRIADRSYQTLKKYTATSIKLGKHYARVTATHSRRLFKRLKTFTKYSIKQAGILTRKYYAIAKKQTLLISKHIVRYLKLLLQLTRHLLFIAWAYLIIATQAIKHAIKVFIAWSIKTSKAVWKTTTRLSKKTWRIFIKYANRIKRTSYSAFVKTLKLIRRTSRYVWKKTRWAWKSGIHVTAIALVQLQRISLKFYKLSLKHIKSVLIALGVLTVIIARKLKHFGIRVLKTSRKIIITLCAFLAALTIGLLHYSERVTKILYAAGIKFCFYIYTAVKYLIAKLYLGLCWLLYLPVVVFRYVDRWLEMLIGLLVGIIRHVFLLLKQLVIYTVKSPILLYKFIVPEFIAQRLKYYAQLIRLDKPIGVLLLMWPTLMALWLAAEGWPDSFVLLIFICGVFLMRSAGCAINDYADRNFDINVKRTKDRPLAAGKISEKEAITVFVVLALIAFMLVLQLNDLAIGLSFTGIALVATYPFMKRYHYIPQAHLGVAFGWAVPMAYAAQANEITAIAGLLFFATVLWTTAYDTMYAMVDYDDDIKIGVKSTAILFGNADKVIIGIIQALVILAFVLIGHQLELTGFYFTGVTIASMLALWQQYLIKDREPALCFRAFLNNNWFGVVLFTGLFCEYQFGDWR